MPAGNNQPAIILVRPQMGENIGAAARAMSNFGLDRLRIVAPRDGWPNPKAVAMASGAGRLLDEAAVCTDLAVAIEDCTHIYATTARPRDLTKRVLAPEAAVSEMIARAGAGERIGVLFGPERAGLENSDVALANTIISVPTNPGFPSLNLAQCVLLVAYEWGRRAVDGDAPADPSGAELATQLEIAKLAEHYEQHLDQTGFFFPPEKADHMRLNMRNLWSRMPLERADVQMFHGILRAICQSADRS